MGASVSGYRGALIGAAGLAAAAMALALHSSLPDTIVETLFLVGVVVAIVGLGIAGYDYSRRSGADLLERGIWQGPAAIQSPPPLLRDALPEFVEELRGLMHAQGRADLARQLDDLHLVDRCRCGDDFCATFDTRSPPQGPWGPGHETIELQPQSGMVHVDLVDQQIVSIEVLNRDDVKARLASWP